jgi:phosphopantothenoylcysteine decarboxylase
MLQSVGSEHDNHYESRHSNSIETLVAARNDGKKHLLLAASGSVATIKSKLASTNYDHLSVS